MWCINADQMYEMMAFVCVHGGLLARLNKQGDGAWCINADQMVCSVLMPIRWCMVY